MSIEKEFKNLIEITEKLLSPEGCPWDREQTPQSLRSWILEEVHEVIEAIDLEDHNLLLEEAGDFFFNALFLAFVAERQGIFSFTDLLQALNKKLIRRHPHVFGPARVSDLKELHAQWEAIKQAESGKETRKSVLDGIPKNYPALARAQKMHRKMLKITFKQNDERAGRAEEDLGQQLWDLVLSCEESGVDAEQALLAVLAAKEKAFREAECQANASDSQ